MISTSTNELKVVFRYGLQLYRINVEQVFLAYVNSLALVLPRVGNVIFRANGSDEKMLYWSSVSEDVG